MPQRSLVLVSATLKVKACLRASRRPCAGIERLQTKAADKGDADAQSILGVCYENGNEVPKSSLEALKWFKMAAAQGQPQAARAAATGRNISAKQEGIIIHKAREARCV